MKRIAPVAVAAFALLAAACSTSTSTDSSYAGHGGETGGGGPSGGSNGEYAATPGSSSSSGGGDSTGETGAAGTFDGDGDGKVQPGTLTAGVWDDNRNFDRFLAYRDGVGQLVGPGLPAFTDAEQRAAHDLSLVAPGAKQTLDVQIILDTTGSMGDEIAYLQTEIDAIIGAVQTKYPNAEQRWSLVAYRDKSDEYVTRHVDFQLDPDLLRAGLDSLRADGGGDFPESPEVAIEEGSQLGWRTGADVARIAFWVADAPHHVEDATAMTNAVRDMRDKGVHVYPVAASGVDELTELTMRGTAQLTGGRYVFLTDDSGIGGAHKTPSIPCYFVTKLDDAILRTVDIELSGTYREPTQSEIIRTGGDPHDGACQVDGQTVLIY